MPNSILANRLRLALLADAHHPNVEQWCEGLHSAGVEVHVLSFEANPGTKLCATLHPITSPFTTKLRYFTSVQAVRNHLQRIQPDVLAAYYVTGYGTLAALTRFHPIVQITSGSDILFSHRNLLLKHLVRFNLRHADLVTAWAPHMADAARRYGVAEDRLFVLPRGILMERFSPYRVKPSNPGSPLRIVSTRALKTWYRVDLLVQAFAQLRAYNVNLTIIGDGPEYTNIQRLIRDLNLDSQIEMRGFVPNADLPALLAQHDCYISTVSSDGVSASLIEAMAVGLFPIVADNEANRLWVNDGTNGLLLSQITPESLATAILKAVSLNDQRATAAEINPQIVENLANAATNAQHYMQRFSQLVTVRK